MRLGLINILLLSVITVNLICPYPVLGDEKPSMLPAHSPIPDKGNLSENDSIFELNKRKFKNSFERDTYAFYLYSLSIRLMAIRNILKISSITRAIGTVLNVDGEKLRKIPESLKRKFSQEKFPDLNNLIDNASVNSFELDKSVVKKMTVNLASRAIDILDLTYQKYNQNIHQQSLVKDYNLDDLTGDLFLSLPFYENAWYEDLYNSALGQIEPSFHFAHLLIASIFIGEKGTENFKTPEQLAKWLYSGIDDEDDFSTLQNIYENSSDLRMTIKDADNGSIPEYIAVYVEEAFRKAIVKSIEMQNSSLDFLSGSQYVCKQNDAISCHSNPYIKQSMLPEQIAFLSDMTSLKIQFAKTYVPIISKDKSNTFWHKLSGIYSKQLDAKKRNFIIPLRLLAVTAAIIVPCGWVALAILVGYETVNIASAFDIADQTRMESETLMSLYDEENSFYNERSYSYSDLGDYRRFIQRKDLYQTEAVSATFWAPIEISLYYFGARWIRKDFISSKEAFLVNAGSIRTYAKAFMFLAISYLLIKDSISLDKENVETIIDDRITQEELGNNPEFLNKIEKRKEDIYIIFETEILNSSEKRSADWDIGFLNFICQTGDCSQINIPIILSDQADIRFFPDESNSYSFYFNYNQFTDDSIPCEVFIFQMAYVYYLYKTSNLTQPKSLIDEDKDNFLTDFFLPGSEKDGKSIVQSSYEYEISLKNAKMSNLFQDAENYASKIAY